MLAWLASIAGLALLGYFAVPHLHRLREEARLRDACRRSGALVLTYDDGPSKGTTPALLGLLREHGARASFFMLGRRVQECPDVAGTVAAAGHEIGFHSQEHKNGWKVLPWVASRDLLEGVRTVSSVGPTTPLLRPPYGKLNAWTWWLARRKRFTLAWWTFDSRDTSAIPAAPEEVAQEILSAGGGVVLMHDLDRDPVRDRYVLELTRALLVGASRAGLRISSLGEVLHK